MYCDPSCACGVHPPYTVEIQCEATTDLEAPVIGGTIRKKTNHQQAYPHPSLSRFVTKTETFWRQRTLTPTLHIHYPLPYAPPPLAHGRHTDRLHCWPSTALVPFIDRVSSVTGNLGGEITPTFPKKTTSVAKVRKEEEEEEAFELSKHQQAHIHTRTMAPKEMTIEMYDEPQQHAGMATASTRAAPMSSATADASLVASKKAAAMSSDSTCEVDAPHKKHKERLRWSTITIHEFGVGLGGSSVPTKGGPAIGLTDKPEFTWTTKVGEMAERSEGVHRFTPEERVRLLQAAGESDGMILRFSRETNIILTSRRRTLVEDLEERRSEKQKKRKAEAVLERPCASFLGRPRMISANYV